MKYKSVLLNELSYNELKAFRDSLSEKTSRNVTFSEAVDDAVGRNALLYRLDPRLRGYIEKFIDSLKKDEGILGAILFGSVAKGTSTKYSDADIFIVAKKDVGDSYDDVHEIIMSLNETKLGLAENGIFVYISPTIVSKNDLDDFKPIYLDVADYGIVLLNKGGTIDRFIDKMRSIKHKREHTEYGEVLTWKTKE